MAPNQGSREPEILDQQPMGLKMQCYSGSVVPRRHLGHPGDAQGGPLGHQASSAALSNAGGPWVPIAVHR